MPLMFFPDNTVLINFGVIDGYDLLQSLTQGNGRWCASVANECSDWTGTYPTMNQAWDVFGEPIRPEGRETGDTRLLRQMMADPNDSSDHEYKHLGEAETITIVVTRGWATGSIFITDDHQAADHARADHIRVVTTWDLLRLASKTGLLSDDDAWTAVQALEQADRRRYPCPPCSEGRDVFLAWLKS